MAEGFKLATEVEDGAALARGVANIGFDFSLTAGLEPFECDVLAVGVEWLDVVGVFEAEAFFGFILALRSLAGTAPGRVANEKA